MPRWLQITLSLVLFAAAMLALRAASAQVPSKADNDASRLALADWTGIAFYCDLQPDDKSNQELCDWVRQKLRLTAISAGVSFISVSDAPYDRYVQLVRQKRLDDVQVRFKILGTTGVSPIGIYVQLSAVSRYIGAAEANEFGSRPEKLPRSAEVVFWSKEMIGASMNRGPDINAALRSSLETLILNLVADFVGARPPTSRQ